MQVLVRCVEGGGGLVGLPRVLRGDVPPWWGCTPGSLVEHGRGGVWAVYYVEELLEGVWLVEGLTVRFRCGLLVGGHSGLRRWLRVRLSRLTSIRGSRRQGCRRSRDGAQSSRLLLVTERDPPYPLSAR